MQTAYGKFGWITIVEIRGWVEMRQIWMEMEAEKLQLPCWLHSNSYIFKQKINGSMPTNPKIDFSK